MCNNPTYNKELLTILLLARSLVAVDNRDRRHVGLPAQHAYAEGATDLPAMFAAIDASLLDENDREFMRSFVTLIDSWINQRHDMLLHSIEKIRSQEKTCALYDESLRFLNEEILVLFERELTAHGVARTFRFWSVHEKIDYIRFANRVIVALQELTYNVCFGYGAVLGFVREHDLIQHDDDLDIIIAFDIDKLKSFTEALSYVSSFLRSKSLVVDGSFPSHIHVGNGVHVLDVFVGFMEGDRLSFFPGIRKGIESKTVFPPIQASLFGEQLSLPANPFAYLDRIYGEDWYSPLPQWRHDWNFNDFDNIR